MKSPVSAPANGGESERQAWHALDAGEVLAQLGSDAARGLSAAEAASRLESHGPNELAAAKRTAAWRILLRQFASVLIIILLVAVGLSAALGHGVEAIVISVIVVFSALLGFVQEFRAERAMEALQRMAAPTATTVRDGVEAEVPARDLVPGDVVLLHAGNKVPADLRLLEAVNLKAEEAALTGESVPVEKNAGLLAAPDAAAGDRRNMAFAGTALAYGRGRGVVVATGMATEFGKIARMLEAVETGRTPLQRNMDHIAHVLARAALAMVVVIVAIGVVRGQPFIEMLVFGIALAVAVVPEALPAVVTISLAIGARRMVRRNALIRRLPAVETLGGVTVICSDKTGTLTQDQMTVRRLWVAGEWLEA